MRSAEHIAEYISYNYKCSGFGDDTKKYLIEDIKSFQRDAIKAAAGKKHGDIEALIRRTNAVDASKDNKSALQPGG